MKKIFFGLANLKISIEHKTKFCALITILVAFTACESISSSNDGTDTPTYPGSYGDLGNNTPTNPGRIAYNAQILRTEKYVRTFSPFIEGVDFPIVTIVSSRTELELYCKIYQMGTNLAAPPIDPTELMDSIGNYSDDFYENNFLVLVLLQEGSGSISHSVEGVYENGDIVITRIVPEIGTDDIAQWHIIIELDNSSKLEQFQVVFSNSEDANPHSGEWIVDDSGSFIARILEIHENLIILYSFVIVEPLEGEDILRSSDRISFGTSNLEKIDISVGDLVTIHYNGYTRETYPAQIVAISWSIYEKN